MSAQPAPAINEELGLGDHAAFFFRDNAERLAFVIPYILSGLRNHERCVYIADENTVPHVLAEFRWAGVDINEATARGALSVITQHDAYLRHGIFEPERTIADLDADVRLALQNGFSGLRVTGEMSWALDLPFALGRLCEYEEELDHHWSDRLAGLCQYNESRFSARVVEDMTACHCIVVRDGKVARRHPRLPADVA
ncbi:MAG TPA: MEDS domain-containing protein [Acidobacteriaceae bacterium]|nr:MEDS domain-containing protein [Acidobacteriaceae bacterium]